MWLNAATSQPIPSYQEQLVLGAAIQRGLADDATRGERRAGKRATDRLVSGNLRLVVPVARKYKRGTDGAGCSLEFIDLLQIGAIGLHTAALKFDPTRGYKFSTVAFWWVQQAITREISFNRGAFRIPTQMQDINRRWHKRPVGQSVAEFIAAWPQHNYTAEKIVEACQAVAARAGVVSADTPLDGCEGEMSTLVELLDNGKDEAAEVLHELDLAAAVATATAIDPDGAALLALKAEGASSNALAPLLGLSPAKTRHQLDAIRHGLREALADQRCLVAA